MRKIVVGVLVLMLIFGSVGVFAESAVVKAPHDIEIAIARDWTDNESMKIIHERYGSNQSWFFWTFEASFNSGKPQRDIYTAIIYDIENKEDIDKIKERYGIGEYEINLVVEGNKNVKIYKTINEAIFYDWKNGESLEKMIERYDFSKEWFHWTFVDTLQPPSKTIYEAIEWDWLNGYDYEGMKERYGFNDNWFQNNFLTKGRNVIERINE